MQNQLRILVIYDDPSDPIVALLANQKEDWHDDITLISTKAFIETMEVCDKVDKTKVSIQWKFKNQDGSIKVWNNHTTYLINRCHDLRAPCYSLFHPDDREYAATEFTAYLNFAFTFFKYRLQPVSYYGLSGSIMPLFIQWDKVKKQIAELQTPPYYVGPYDRLKWPKAIINPNPYDFTYWIAENVSHNVKTDYIFAYKRPSGQPVFVYITPIGADIVKSETLSKIEINETLLKHLAINVGKNLGISVGEVLFFVSKKQIVFGAATPYIVNAKNSSNFKELTLKALTTVSSYENNKHFSEKNNTQQNIGKTRKFLLIGSTKDRTVNSLKFGRVFYKEGILFSIEEFMSHWNFTYTNGKLNFYTKDQIIDTIRAIYYRPCNQQAYTNTSLDLLNSCLDSFNKLVYGRSSSQYINSSKPLQLANSIPILNHHQTITLPASTIIKNSKHIKEIMSSSTGINYITKSISGIRSIVVNNQTFSKWEKAGLNALPTLFQKQIEGDDIRVHVCHSQVIAIKITNKDKVDYRYSDTSLFEKINIPQDIINFCLKISWLEQNPLVGIDLIQTTEGYIFLESNPMPGWDYFFKEKKSKEKICRAIMDT